MIKDRLGEDRLVLSNDALYNDKQMGENYSDFNILKIIRIEDYINKEFVAKVSSKKNYKIYLMKKINIDRNPGKIELMKKEIEELKNLNHQNIIKYHKLVEDDDNNIYIIKEFVDNGGLNYIFEGHKSMQIPIKENTLWNIFMQCMSGLEYIHNNNIIHKKISLNNILMTENKVIKLDDIQFSFISGDNSEKDKSTDIKEMGEAFKSLMSIVGGYKYSKEMHDIIQTIEKEYKNKSATYFLGIIFDEYIKKVAKITSINSIFSACYHSLNSIIK